MRGPVTLEMIFKEVRECVDRCRRVETRVTKFLEAQGFDTQVQRPLWHQGKIEVPSRATSVKDIISVVPTAWPKDEMIEVVHKGEFLMEIALTPAD